MPVGVVDILSDVLEAESMPEISISIKVNRVLSAEKYLQEPQRCLYIHISWFFGPRTSETCQGAAGKLM